MCVIRQTIKTVGSGPYDGNILYELDDIIKTKTVDFGRYILYIRYGTKLEFQDAKEYCQNMYGYLPIPVTQSENDFLKSLGSTWLGPGI